MRKPSSIPVEFNGSIVGSIRLRHRTWQFRCRQNGLLKEITLHGVRDLEEALRQAKKSWELGGACPVPQGIVSLHENKPTTLGKALTQYQAQYAAQNRESSLQRTMPTIRAFVAFLGGETLAPQLITRRHLLAFRDKRAHEVSPSTVNSDLQRVKAFVNWLRAEEVVLNNPTFKVRRLKTSTVAQETIDPETVTRVVEAFTEPWLADLAVILANTGLRPQEALHIRAIDVEPEQRLLRIRAWEMHGQKWEIKDHEDRALALNDPALAVLLRRKLAARDGILFPTPTGMAWEYHNFASEWRKALPRAHNAQVSPYAFRHFFATHAVLQGWTVEKLSKYLGHASIATTQRYYADMRAIAMIGAPPILAHERKESQV